MSRFLILLAAAALAAGVGTGAVGAAGSSSKGGASSLAITTHPRPTTWANFDPTHLRCTTRFGDPFLRHGGIVNGIAAMSGQRLASAGSDGMVRLWDMRNGKQLAQFFGDGGMIEVIVLPGEEQLLGMGERGTFLWDLKTGKSLHDFREGKGSSHMAFDPKNQRLAFDLNDSVSVHDLPGRKELFQFPIPGRMLAGLAFNTQGDLIVGSSDSKIYLLAGASQAPQVLKPEDKEIAQESLHTSSITALVSSPAHDKAFVCCASPWLMDLANGQRLWTARKVSEPWRGAFSADGKRIAAVGDKDLYLLDSANGTLLWSAAVPGSGHCGLGFSLDGAEIYCGSDSLICRFDAATGRQLYPPLDKPLRNWAVHTSVVPGTDLLVESGGNRSGGVRLIDRNSGLVKAEYLVGQPVVNSAVSPDGRFIMVRKAQTIPILQLTTGRQVAVYMREQDQNYWYPPGCMSPDGQKCIILAGGEFRVYDPAEDLIDYQERVSRGAGMVNGTGQREAMICYDRIKILNFGGHVLQELPTEKMDGGTVRYCAFFPGDQKLLAATEHGLYFWSGQGSKIQPRKLSSDEIQKAIGQLGDASFAKREAATNLLISGGEAVLPALKQVTSSDMEVKDRIAKVEKQVTVCDFTLRSAVHLPCTGKEVTLPGIGVTVTTPCPVFWNLAVHPDGVHFAALRGELFSRCIIFGRIDGEKIKLLCQVIPEEIPNSIEFDDRGFLVTGNLNGTTTIYDSGPGGLPSQPVEQVDEVKGL